ncbi:HlyC/CorC family transporter [Nesterenkonia salmonea]|uniref:HlyC/CorC family transporter n=1 Tax=Nesterenkonia salmonea TaxID=1804987 RepID=A0A5R9B884_9MICC|nr:hemolysin family protein [Nesterenkonia salmonea]TLP94071.1 HlyC/CorC family transporter [Nesterenkonia salmonea]
MEWILLLVGILLILGNGFFVAVEFALVALDQPTVQRAIDLGDKRAIPLMKCLKSLSTQLSSCQLGITLNTLLIGYVTEPALGSLLEPVMEAVGVPDAAAFGVSLFVAMLIATLVTMLIGELVPKNLAVAESFRIGRALARPQLMFTTVFKPLIIVLNGFSNKVLNRFGLEVKEELSGARTPEELSAMVRRSASLGTLDEQAATFLDRTLRFSEQTATDVMTPRPRMVTIDADASLDELIVTARRTGHSRFPVLGESGIDEVRGAVHVKKAVAVPRSKREPLVAATLMSEVTRVPETIHLDALISELRRAPLQIAVVEDEYGGTAGVVTLEDLVEEIVGEVAVEDEYGGTAGVVTLEDLVEEIVGEVADEHDALTPGVLQSASGEWYFPGLMRPDEINAQILELNIPEDSAYETVAGFILYELGRVAALGDEVEFAAGRLRVVGIDGRRIDRVKFVPDVESRRAALQAHTERVQKLAEERAERQRTGGR